MKKSVLLASTLLLLAASFAVTIFAWTRPLGHWDVIAYVAVALKTMGASGEELRQATYEIIEKAYDPATFAVLTSTPEATGHGLYRYTVYSDPVALEQQLPFYRMRMAYILLMQLLAPVSNGLVGAAQVLSASCAGLITLLTGCFLMRGERGLPPLAALLVLPLVIAGAGVLEVGRLETPDALAALIALTAVMLLHSNRLVAFLLLILLVLVRTDGVLLTGLAIVLLMLEGERRILYYGLGAAAVGLYVFLNVHYDHYGHLTLFNFTLMNPAPDPYPASMDIEQDILAYVKIYVFALIRFATTLLLIAVLMLLVAVDARFTGRVMHLTAQAALAAAFMAVHFILFPLGSDRYYIFPMIFIFVYMIQTLFAWRFGTGFKLACG